MIKEDKLAKRGNKKMKDKLWWLKAAILNYLKTHERVDSPEIVSYMKVRCDVTLTALKELEGEGIVERYWNGRYYEVIKR